MKINEVLNDFVRVCSERLDLEGIIQFGSSTYSDDSHDIDLIFYFKGDLVSIEEIFKLVKIIKNFEEKSGEVVFDFGGSARKRKGKYFISIIYLGKKELNVVHNPHDLFFYKNLSEDKNKKILYGEDCLKNFNFKLTNQHLFEMLSVDLKHSLRESLDDEEYKLEASYFLFKTFLRAMLIDEGILKKEKLLLFFKKKYGDKIKLPLNSEKILSHDLKKEDFENILNFSNDCLGFLVK
ncbi:hypothetical protein KAJ38_01125 [Candidatus Pacearchaeota archaeon]|nr:hypothetical protein [Candidatus Pacearchaeota archaeon]